MASLLPRLLRSDSQEVRDAHDLLQHAFDNPFDLVYRANAHRIAIGWSWGQVAHSAAVSVRDLEQAVAGKLCRPGTLLALAVWLDRNTVSR